MLRAAIHRICGGWNCVCPRGCVRSIDHTAAFLASMFKAVMEATMKRTLLLCALAVASALRDLDEWTHRFAIAWKQWKRGRTRLSLSTAQRETTTKAGPSQ
jgi:hypothetical protein